MYVPGPGQYQTKNMIGNDGPAKSMSGRAVVDL